MGTFFKGRETILVGRPGFKPGGWRHASPGGFDSHSLPPYSFPPFCAAGAAPPSCGAPLALRGGTHQAARQLRLRGCAPRCSLLAGAPFVTEGERHD